MRRNFISNVKIKTHCSKHENVSCDAGVIVGSKVCVCEGVGGGRGGIRQCLLDVPLPVIDAVESITED